MNLTILPKKTRHQRPYFSLFHHRSRTCHQRTIFSLFHHRSQTRHQHTIFNLFHYRNTKSILILIFQNQVGLVLIQILSKYLSSSEVKCLVQIRRCLFEIHPQTVFLQKITLLAPLVHTFSNHHRGDQA